MGGYWSGSFHLTKIGGSTYLYLSQGNVADADIYWVLVSNGAVVGDWNRIITVANAFDVVTTACGDLLYTDFADSIYLKTDDNDLRMIQFENIRPTSISFSSKYGDLFVGDYSARTGTVGIVRIRNGGITTYNPGYTTMTSSDFYNGMYITDIVDSMEIAHIDVISNSLSSSNPPQLGGIICDRTVTETSTTTNTATIIETTENIITTTVGGTTAQTTNTVETTTVITEQKSELPIPILPIILVFIIPILLRKRR